MTPLPRTSTFKSHLPQPQRPSPLRGRAIAYGARSARCSPLPRAGGGLGWGRRRFTSTRSSHERTTPTPTLPQLGGGDKQCASSYAIALPCGGRSFPLANDVHGNLRADLHDHAATYLALEDLL